MMKLKVKLRKEIFFYEQLKKYKLNLPDFDVQNELKSEPSSIIS